jgi:hypothetical protein
MILKAAPTNAGLYILQVFLELPHFTLKNVRRTCNTHQKSFVGIFSPRKDDCADSGCIGVQSNGVITHIQI